MERFEISQYKDVKSMNLSGGNQRKVCTAISLIGRPKVRTAFQEVSIIMFVTQFILMDEPTSGMDPGSRSQVREIIKEVVRGGQSVLMTSHSMAECDALCDR